ncbi:hypothetical protein CXB51_032028 [Gossypium anomalum]|uniref:RNase H type-1 domain-containing protein n=1 Tax=Gossypium anomalum TaxID=47600 RepID=A0A8J5XRT7_9ROSI|nr:hypothetical protein CXB51_032028 [Gossypium anomalum]
MSRARLRRRSRVRGALHWCSIESGRKCPAWFWCPPCFGGVKFNVCGVESEDEVGCGGVLRNSDGVARALFSGPFAAKDSLATKVGVISIALDVFLAMGWKGKCSLIIKVGSMGVFNWVENKGLRPWLMFSLFKEVEFRLSRIGNVSFSKVDKNGNKMAFALAVAGLSFRFWCPPCFGGVKFNVCGVESEDEVGCGGVLRNSDGVARALFSGPFAAKDSLATKVGVISIALDVFLAMGWKGKCSLIIKVGSMGVFNWVENKGLRPWLMFSLFKEVEFRLSRIGNVSFSKVDKNGNKMAFALAVAGLKRQDMFKA